MTSNDQRYWPAKESERKTTHNRVLVRNQMEMGFLQQQTMPSEALDSRVSQACAPLPNVLTAIGPTKASLAVLLVAQVGPNISPPVRPQPRQSRG